MLKNSSFTSISLALACATPVLLSTSTPAQAQATAPSVVVRSLTGEVIKLSIGEAEGAKVGAVYSNTNAKIQIFEVDANQSLARILESTPGFVVTVGDTAKFIGLEPLVNPSAKTGTVATNQKLPSAPVVAVRGAYVTLGIGAKEGLVPGAIYAMPILGDSLARMVVTAVRDGDSTAVLQSVAEGFTPTVGEMARFVAIEAVPENLRPANPASTGTLAPTLPNVAVGSAPVNAALPISITGSTATVTSLDGTNNVVISAGSNHGVISGQTVPILRSGAIVGLARIVAVREKDATAFVLWRDESQSAITTGDAIGLLGTSAKTGIPALNPKAEEIPAVLVKHETGASNESVPKADRTYDLLASLAATGLITSQPARVFHDNGARRHHASEDVIFSRAQIANLIREAMARYEGTGSRDGAALSILAKDYRKDLLAQGVTEASLNKLTNKGLQFGISTFSRATLTGGDNKRDNLDPFAERFGARRTKTGLDTRINIFSTLSDNLNLYGSVDTGSKIREGEKNETEVRKFYLHYDAKSLLRGLNIELGRKEYWWGPGQYGSGVIGDAAGGLDSLHTSFKRGSYELQGIYAYLGKGPGGGARSLYGQNLSVRIGKGAKIGVNSTLLSPKDKFDPKLFLASFSPIPLYAVDRGNDDSNAIGNTNAVVGAFGEVAVGKGARVYGELILDDFSANSNNDIENRDGSVLGLQLFDPKDPARAGLKFEYARFNSWAYTYNPTQLGRDGDYEYYNDRAPLGYPIAPQFPATFGGAESLRLEAYYRPMKRLWINGGLEFSDINPQDQNPASPGETGFSRQQIYRFTAAYELSRNWSITGRAQRVATDQPNFIKGEDSLKDKFLSLEIGRSF
jgi:hypothetical protein